MKPSVTGTLALFVVSVGLVVNGHCQTFLTNGLVAHYPFNGNANDESGRGYNGTPNGVTLTTDRFVQPASAYLFGGDGDHVRVQPAPNFWSVGKMTFSCWVQIQPGGLYMPRIFSNGTLDVGLTDTSGNPQVFFTGWGNSRQLRSGHLRSGVYYHLAGTYDGSTMRLYVDGSEVSSTNVSWTFQLTSLPLGIGRNLDTGTDWFAGVIDDIRLYNRALPSSEVAQIYAIESGPRLDLIKAVKPSFTGLYVGTNYQLQVSGDLNAWTNHGAAFTATNTSLVYPQYWDVENWGSLYFRLKMTP